MSEKNIFIIAIVVLLIGVLGGAYVFKNKLQKNSAPYVSPATTVDNTKTMPTEEFEQQFLQDGLQTNTAIRSIDLLDVLDGGVKKDGIPALDHPPFTSIADADPTITDDTLGVLVRADQTVKFYPYNILVWHEIVNDTLDEKPYVITFCPLCGSAIVFDAIVEGVPHTFGVSGKLLNSNLLMYDKQTESLWSQIIGEAVVGESTGKVLTVYPSQILTFSQVKQSYPTAEVLSGNTGYTRTYGFYPYGDYDNNDELFFPVSIEDNRLPAKTVMHIVNTKEHSIAFDRAKLVEVGEAVVTLPNETQVIATVENGEIIVKYANDPTQKALPGYTAMWFSWATNHQENGIVWPTK